MDDFLFSPLPQAVEQLFSFFSEIGEELFLVGGCVRDAWLGQPIHDYDFTTSALPQNLLHSWEERGNKALPTGLAHGTVTLCLSGERFEVTTMRREGMYRDGRRPDTVSFTQSLEEDLARRDFSCNAMAWSPQTGLIDPYGGRSDLEAGVLRTVGRPIDRFQEDHLRLLRALRFSLRENLQIEEETAKSWKTCLPLLSRLSGERVQQELRSILHLPLGEKNLDRLRLALAAFAGCPASLNPHFSWSHLPPSFPLRLRALVEESLFNEEEKEKRALAQKLKLSKKDFRCFTAVVRPLPPAKRELLAAYLAQVPNEREVEDALLYWEASGREVGAQRLEIHHLQAEHLPLRREELALPASEIIEILGIPAGPLLGQAQEQLLRQVWRGEIPNETKKLRQALAKRERLLKEKTSRDIPGGEDQLDYLKRTSC